MTRHLASRKIFVRRALAMRCPPRYWPNPPEGGVAAGEGRARTMRPDDTIERGPSLRQCRSCWNRRVGHRCDADADASWGGLKRAWVSATVAECPRIWGEEGDGRSVPL